MNEVKKYLECDCGSIDHIVRLSYFKDEPDLLYLEIHLSGAGFWGRVRKGIRYILGRKSMWGDFDEFVLCPVKMKKFRDEIDAVIKLSD